MNQSKPSELSDLACDQACGSDRIEQLMCYIYIHRSEQLTLSALADRLYLSPNYLSQTFKRYSGETIIQYLEDLRMIDAKRALEHTSFTIHQIASEIGYSNAAYFSTIFKKHYGVSPREWRNSYHRNSPRRLAQMIHDQAYSMDDSDHDLLSLILSSAPEQLAHLSADTTTPRGE